MNDDKEIKKEEKEVDTRSPLEKAGEAVENFFDTAEEIVYHPDKGITEDIPASLEGPEHRIYLKHETRRNLHKKIFGHKWVYITFGIIFGLGILGLIITSIIKVLLTQ